jgi:tetratricopeptide (TPR) repeat protein
LIMKIKNVILKSLIIWPALLLLEPLSSSGSEEIERLFRHQRYDEVITNIEAELKEKAPLDSAALLFDLGKAYYKRGLIYGSFYETGRELEKDDYERFEKYGIKTCLPFYLGVCDFEEGLYPEAIDEFNALKNLKGISKTQQLLASVWIEASRFRLGQNEAVTSLEEIKRANNGNPLVVSEVSFFLSYLVNQDKEALNSIQGRKPPPDSFANRFYRNLAYIYMKNAMPEKAKEAYGMIRPEREEFVSNINPELQISYYDLTVIKVMALLNHYFSEQALSGITKERVSYQQWHTALWYRGQNAFFLGDYPKAIEFLSQSEHPVAMVHLGSAYYVSGKKTEAMAVWDKVEMANDDRSQRELGQQLITLQVNPDKGVKLCKQALEHIIKTDPKESSGYFRSLGWGYLKTGDVDSAVKILNEGYNYSKANDLDFYEPELFNERAYCLYRKSKLNWGEAIEIYFTLLKRYPVVRQLHNALQGIAVSESSGMGISKFEK